MITILFWLIGITTIEARLDSDSYRVRESAEREVILLWLINPQYVNRLIDRTESAEVRARATRARGRAITAYLDSLGEPPWCDWPLYSVANSGWPTARPPEIEGGPWVPIFPEFAEKMRGELPHAEDRYQYDYLRYRLLQREWARAYLLAGGYRWVVEVDWFLGGLVERDYWQSRDRPQLPPIKWW